MRQLLYMVATATALLATPSLAAVSVCTTPNCVATDENVLIVKDVGDSILGATNNTHKAVVFTSPITGESLVGDANGQADVSAEDGVLNGLTMTMLNNNTFGTAVFNLFPLAGNSGPETELIRLFYFNAGGVFGSTDLEVSGNGQNFFGIFGTAGERFQGFTWLSDPIDLGWQDIRQVRLGDVQGPVINPTGPVPEPATWAMMLIGFGFVGAAMRRRGHADQARVKFDFA